MTSDEVPDDVGRLWRLPVGRRSDRRGRPAVLDVHRVVSAAVTLVESVGLAGVTLPKVAEALDVTTMSLYRHIGSKGELFVLMEDMAWGLPPSLEIPNGRWRTGLEHWALAQRSLLQRHPWLLQVPVSGPPRGPHLIAWVDAGLRTLHDTGLDWAAKVGVLTVVSGYIKNAELMAQQLATARKGLGLVQEEVEQRYGRAMAILVDPGQYPEASALFRAGVFEPVAGDVHGNSTDPDDDFSFGLTLVLDGVATTVERAG